MKKKPIELMICLDGVTCSKCEDLNCDPVVCPHFCHDLDIEDAKELGFD